MGERTVKAEQRVTEEVPGGQNALVRPRRMRPHNADVVRRARLHADGKTLVVRDRRLRERRYPVGPGGIRRAVFVPPPTDEWETVTKRPAERWGVLVFQNEDGRDLLRVPLAEWLPESGVVGILDLKPAKCLDRTGLRELTAALGVPLEEKPPSKPGEPEPPEPGSGQAPDRAVHRELPRWHSWIRGLGAFGWLVALAVAFAGDVDWCLPIAAGALFAVPAADSVLRAGARWRNRQEGGRRFAEAVVITPDPEPGAGATPRFRRTASVRVLPGDVVLTDTAGQERWLGRDGAHGVARLVRLVSAGDRQPLGIEFRDRSGEARALLPWRFWFAGPQGRSRWEETVSAFSVAAVDEEVRASRRPAGATKPWWDGHSLAADARLMSPLPAKEARAETSWHSSVIGGNELLLVPLFSLVLLAGLFGDTVAAQLAGLFSALTIVAEWGPAATRALFSRFHYDKPNENA
ncbi:hypothetical protein AB0E08_40265 [Streptomyces sp. NPDC048281]|uniref:hypothetical protein n=1 Tax=Streptomyces sp. NPDC048281 TaxID=3154715 RepID=UPI0034272001